MKTIEEMRKRLAEINAQLEEYKAIENFTDEDEQKIEALYGEFTGLKKNIETREKIENMNVEATTSTRKTVPTPVAPKAEVTDTRMSRNLGFNNQGDYLMAVKDAASGRMDRRFQNVAYEKYGEDGGFLIPEDFMGEIQKKMESDESLLPKTRGINVSGNSLTLPIDETSPWSGGVLAYWTAEGATITDSKPAFKQASWRLHKLAAMVKTTDELLDDAPALASYINMAAPAAINQKINEAILTGDGVGKPTGILESGFKVAVAKESGQTADTVVAANVIKMYSRMLPASRAKAVWYINPAVEEQLRLAQDPASNYIYLAPGSQLNQTPYGMLLGRPVIPMVGSGMKALGDEGDIIFADLSYYYTIKKTAGIKQAVSTHLYFDRDQTAFKFIFRLDGSCPFQSAVTTENGSYSMSGLVTLAERA